MLCGRQEVSELDPMLIKAGLPFSLKTLRRKPINHILNGAARCGRARKTQYKTDEYISVKMKTGKEVTEHCASGREHDYGRWI